MTRSSVCPHPTFLGTAGRSSFRQHPDRSFRERLRHVVLEGFSGQFAGHGRRGRTISLCGFRQPAGRHRTAFGLDRRHRHGGQLDHAAVRRHADRPLWTAAGLAVRAGAARLRVLRTRAGDALSGCEHPRSGCRRCLCGPADRHVVRDCRHLRFVDGVHRQPSAGGADGRIAGHAGHVRVPGHDPGRLGERPVVERRGAFGGGHRTDVCWLRACSRSPRSPRRVGPPPAIGIPCPGGVRRCGG